MASDKVISLAEVAKHNTVASCWIVVEGKVYDATSYLQPHPGGKEIILKQAGAVCFVFLKTQHPPSPLLFRPAPLPLRPRTRRAPPITLRNLFRR